MLLVLLSSLLACVKPYEEQPVLDFTEVPFANGLVNTTSARIRTYETSLPCPDGQGARFYVVYRDDQETPGPVALVFHSGAFDYVQEPAAAPEDPLYQVTWRSDSRLSRDWTDRMVWETLGMYPGTVDPAELHLGALPAALADAGVTQILPGNCWGDLWHNEAGVQDNAFATENLSRNGRTFAWWMVRMLIEDGFAATQGVELPVAMGQDLYLVGLGDGGRGAVELLTHPGMPEVEGVLVDSSPDVLSPYLDPRQELEDQAKGLARLWPEPEDLAEIDDWSLQALARAQSVPAMFGGGDSGARDGGATDTGSSDTAALEEGGIPDLASFQLPPRLALVWSQADPQLPLSATQSSAAELEAREGTWVIDTRIRGHVFSNQDIEASRFLVDYLLNGNKGPISWTSTGTP